MFVSLGRGFWEGQAATAAWHASARAPVVMMVASLFIVSLLLMVRADPIYLRKSTVRMAASVARTVRCPS